MCHQWQENFLMKCLAPHRRAETGPQLVLDFGMSVGLFSAHLQKLFPHQFCTAIRNHCWRLNGTDCVFACSANVRTIFAYCVKILMLSSPKSFFHVNWSHKKKTKTKHPLHKSLNVGCRMTCFHWTSLSYGLRFMSGLSSFFSEPIPPSSLCFLQVNQPFFFLQPRWISITYNAEYPF